MFSLKFDDIGLHQNEPKMRFGAKGFLSVPSVGMRLAPEILILELFRDIFFSSDSPAQMKTRELRPDMRNEDSNEFVLDRVGARAVVAALRNRRKQSRQSKLMTFHAPAYPTLAANAWLSKKRERVITRLLFEGAFAQHFWFQGETSRGSKLQNSVVDVILTACIGTPKRHVPEVSAYPDILAGAIGSTTEGIDVKVSRERLLNLCRPSETILDRLNDELAARTVEDFVAICKLEQSLPRMLWLRVLMTHLRLALPMWLLAQMRITTLVHGWLIEAIDNQRIPPEADIVRCLQTRNRNLLCPTLTPTRELFGSIREYMKSRVELNVLLYCLETLTPEKISNKQITVTKAGANYLPLSELLEIAKSSRDRIQGCAEWRESPSVCVFLRRHCETYRAWRDPLNKGQGKNIEEFLRILYRPEMGDDVGGHLLLRQGRGETAGFLVFPGNLLLQTFTSLAAKAKWNSDNTVAGGGKLVLEDIEEHFSQYGINFSQAADARPLLMQELQALGLLSGSSDAGSSVSVFCPF